MYWWIFFAAALVLALVFVPFKEWKRLYPVGIFGILLAFCINSKLIDLGAFSFSGEAAQIYDVPLAYLLSFFPGGVLFAHFWFRSWTGRLMYIFLTSFIFFVLEYITVIFGMYQHIEWFLIDSIILKLIGLTVFLWFSEWVIDRTDAR